MFGIGWAEMVVIGLVALIVVGPDKLPEMAKTIGKIYGQLRRATQEASQALTAEVDLINTTANETSQPGPSDEMNHQTNLGPQTASPATPPNPGEPDLASTQKDVESGSPQPPMGPQ